MTDTDTITLTVTLDRKQWNDVFDGLADIREMSDRLQTVADAFDLLGMAGPFAKISDLAAEIATHTLGMQRILIDADHSEAIDNVVKFQSNREA